MARFLSTGSALFVAAMMVTLSLGCGEKTSETEVTANVAKTFEDLPNCSQGKYAIVYYVEVEDQFYYCDGREYLALNPLDDSCTVEDNGDGTKTVRCPDGTFVTVNNVECLHEPGVCDDGDACSADVCDQAVGCVSFPVDCDDNDVCTADSCDSATGCLNDQIICDDGDLCTVDSCDPATGCGSTPVVCGPGDVCDPTDGECKHVPVCVCFTKQDLDYIHVPGVPDWNLCYDIQRTDPAGFYLSWEGTGFYAAATQQYNSRSGQIEDRCYGAMRRYPYGTYAYVQAFETYYPSHALLQEGDWAVCLQLLKDKAAELGLVCGVLTATAVESAGSQLPQPDDSPPVEALPE